MKPMNIRRTLIGACVTGGEFQEVVAIIGRLQRFLPEYGMTKADSVFAERVKRVEDLERQLAVERALFREQAMRILESAIANWTPEEIEIATGYSV